MTTTIPQQGNTKYILEQLETLIESAQTGVDCNDPNNSESYAALVHVRCFVRGEPVYDEPNPVSLPDILKQAERVEQLQKELQKELEWRKGFGRGLQDENRLLRAQLEAAKQDAIEADTRLARAESWIDDLMQGVNNLADRAFDAEAIIERLQDQVSEIAHEESTAHESHLLYKSEANTLKSAFEEAHARCEQLERDNQQLTTALDNMAVVIRVLLGTKEAI